MLPRGRPSISRSFSWVGRFGFALVLLATVMIAVGATAGPASAATGNMLPPFDIGTTWNICQGYDSQVTHTAGSTSEYGLDLTGSGCNSDAAGRNVRAPISGTVSYWQASYGNLCVNIAGNRSYTLTHIDASVTSGSVTAGQLVGTIAAAGTRNNNGLAHLHFQIWAASNCYNSSVIPFDTADTTRICGAPDLAASGPNSGSSQGIWSGTTFTAADCSGGGGAVRTISTSDGHVQTFKISGGALSENWYSPLDGTTGAWTQPAAPPEQAVGTPTVVQRPGQNVIDAFVRGSNNQVYETWYNFQYGNWGGWIGMGGGPLGITSDPQVQATADGNYQVFGTGGGYVEQNWFSSNGSYGGWTTSAGLGAGAVGSPALAPRTGQNVIDAFVRGGNNQVYATWYNFQTGGWGGWIGLGGGPLSFTSDPQVVATSDSHDQVFGTGGGYVEQNWYSPLNGTYGGWATSAGLAAGAVGSPAIAPRTGQNVIDAFVRGGNNQVYATWYSFQTGGWGGWIGLGGGPAGFTTDAQVQMTSDGNDQVFGTGPGYVEQDWFSPTSGAYGGWRTM